jgi:hypothetical protein
MRTAYDIVLTLEMYLDPGRPFSRANAQVILEAVAKTAMPANITVAMITQA